MGLRVADQAVGVSIRYRKDERDGHRATVLLASLDHLRPRAIGHIPIASRIDDDISVPRPGALFGGGLHADDPVPVHHHIGNRAVEAIVTAHRFQRLKCSQTQILGVHVHAIPIHPAIAAGGPGIRAVRRQARDEHLVHASPAATFQEHAIHRHPQGNARHAAQKGASFEQQRVRSHPGGGQGRPQACGTATGNDDLVAIGQGNAWLEGVPCQHRAYSIIKQAQATGHGPVTLERGESDRARLSTP